MFLACDLFQTIWTYAAALKQEGEIMELHNYIIWHILHKHPEGRNLA